MGICDVCNLGLGEKEGYLLTTLEVVSTPGYWKKVLSGPMALSTLSWDGVTIDDSLKANYAEMMASQKTPWMICNECIGIFKVDKARARDYAIRWYETGGTFNPPGTGPAPLSAVDMGDGRKLQRVQEPVSKISQAPKSDSSCFIATAAFTSSSREVYVLRQFRDRILRQHHLGRMFISLYYKASPPIANWIARSSVRRRITRSVLLPVVKIGQYAIKDD